MYSTQQSTVHFSKILQFCACKAYSAHCTALYYLRTVTFTVRVLYWRIKRATVQYYTRTNHMKINQQILYFLKLILLL